MKNTASKTSIAEKPALDRPARLTRAVVPLLAAASLALLAGCALTQRHSITVGAVPDDYRTNHPIVIAEKQMVLDLPVAAEDRGMTHSQRIAIDGFLDNYDRSAAPVVTITVPSGSGNELAAGDAAHDMHQFLRKRGIYRSRLTMTSYQAPSVDISAPIRISYIAMRAQTGKCGRWPNDLLDDSENKHYANFGCAYQNNLAAQIADPADFLGPRKLTEVDAEKRGVAIDEYRKPPVVANSEVDY